MTIEHLKNEYEENHWEVIRIDIYKKGNLTLAKFEDLEYTPSVKTIETISNSHWNNSLSTELNNFTQNGFDLYFSLAFDYYLINGGLASPNEVRFYGWSNTLVELVHTKTARPISLPEVG